MAIQTEVDQKERDLKPNLEYDLLIWLEKPFDLHKPDGEYHHATIRNAQKIPSIGERIDSGIFPDDFEVFRVFDVRHDISPLFATPYSLGRNPEKPKELSEENKIRVYAYRVKTLEEEI